MTTATTADRSEFRHILFSGTIVGLVTSAGVSAALLPAFFATSRTTQGIASAAAIGLWGTIVFMAVDIVVLRPLHAFPWTWDAVAGGSTWWYLPIWWMLGTFLAWMGGIVTAARARRGGEVSIPALALPVVVGAAAVALILTLARLHIYLPVAAGAGFAVVLTGRALGAIVRKA